MDYLNIVLAGYSNSNSRKHLDKYFVREAKKAVKEFFEADEFFDGCIEAMNDIEKHIEYRFKDRKNKVGLMLIYAENGTLRYTDNDKTKTDKERNKETIENCKHELSKLRKSDFPANLNHIDGRYTGTLSFEEVLTIKEAINEAQDMYINGKADRDMGDNEKAEPEKIELLFEHISKYNKIMEILVSKGLISQGTHLWKDEKNGNKAYLVAIIKNLRTKGYYKNNARLTNEQIVKICKKSFGWVVGIDTVKKTKTNSFKLDFIPLASTI